MQVANGSAGGIRLAELVATLSLATDLGRGQPLEHCVRQTAIALRIADRLGLSEEERLATYYVCLLDSVYCHADAREQAAWFGDDFHAKAVTYEADTESLAFVLLVLRLVASSERGAARVRKLAAFPTRAIKETDEWVRGHATLQSEFAERIGLPPVVCDALRQSYERWDGKGLPRGIAGASIPIAVRVLALADHAEVYHRRGGPAAARAAIRARRGALIDPALADLFEAAAEDLLAGLDETSRWEEVIDEEPGLARTVAASELDGVLEAMADLVDMKAPHMAGHSRGVAGLAAEAGRMSGLAEEDVDTVRRAGWVHDLGRLGVSNAIWDKPGPLSASERERVRMHAYLTDRMLAGIPSLAAVRERAARHHERLDGSGYPRGLGAAELSPADRILAAADAYHAMTEPRPYRRARSAADAAAELRADVRAGRLDGGAVDAVLSAAGHRRTGRREWPGGLTAREVDVLSRLARGSTTKEIAADLVVTPRTVGTHIEHIYLKIGVSSRARATLWATQHGLVGSYEAG